MVLKHVLLRRLCPCIFATIFIELMVIKGPPAIRVIHGVVKLLVFYAVVKLLVFYAVVKLLVFYAVVKLLVCYAAAMHLLVGLGDVVILGALPESMVRTFYSTFAPLTDTVGLEVAVSASLFGPVPS
jgi:hypothetical protein